MRCPVCKENRIIACSLGVCGECIRAGGKDLRKVIRKAHARVRERFDDPPEVPRTRDLPACDVCVNACSPPEGNRGFCGLRSRNGGEMGLHDGPSLSWYYDPLPTNCVADFVCPAGTGAGYPEFAVRNGPELGMKNLAVFYHSCSFNCLFCQNWHYREARSMRGSRIPSPMLAAAVDDETTCICYFGGDPGTQVEHAIEASIEARKRVKGRPLRICWETNGSVSTEYFEEMVKLSLESGGCVKVDLKAFDDSLHRALTGSSNRRTLQNFRRLAARARERPEPPLAVASTLMVLAPRDHVHHHLPMVPGYVDAREVRSIAGFITALDRDIPYSLLAFHPQFAMSDLPRTPRKQAEECCDAAREQGLRRVRVGNVHLL